MNTQGQTYNETNNKHQLNKSIMFVKLENGKLKDVDVTQVTAENYIVPEDEQALYHCIVEVRKFDPNTGRRLSVPRVQKFGKKEFETLVRDNLRQQGYTVEILYNPTEYLAEKAATEQALKRQAKEQRLAAEQAARQAEIDAAVKAALAKQAAEFEAQAKAKSEKKGGQK